MLYPLLKSVLFKMDAERAHGLVCTALRAGTPLLEIAARLGLTFQPAPQDEFQVWGMNFRSRIGLAAGFDKNAELIRPMAALGFGFIEVGTVTPRPQPGNPRPRLGRDPARELLWNRMGFNNEGSEVVAHRIALLRESGHIPEGFRVGVNLGKNKDTPAEEAANDYLLGVDRLAHLADYLVLNVSSPNTPGLRQLQEVDFLRPLLLRVGERLSSLPRRVPCLVKFAPELNQEQVGALLEGLDSVVDGWVATNTVMGSGPGALSGATGGWSGPIVAPYSRQFLKWLGEGSRKPSISVGGVAHGGEARARIDMGAALVQLYSGWVYRGPAVVAELTRALRSIALK